MLKRPHNRRHIMWTTLAAMLSLVSVNTACTQEPIHTQRAEWRKHSLDGHARDQLQAGPRRASLLAPSDRVGDLLQHPTLQRYGRLLLPWDAHSYDEEMHLSDIDSLLPYHSHVVPDVTVSGLNRIIADEATGKKVFYSFYTEEQRRLDPTKRHAGLFFFRGRPGAPFALISPGGGFEYVGSVHEGFPYAVGISKAGYNAFVLKYRAGLGGLVATEDLAAALSSIMRRADTLSVARESYSLWGSSAGARMAASIGSHGAARFGGDTMANPAAVIMAYTGHSDTSADEPPTFVVVGEEDGIAPPSVMARRVAALRAAGTPIEFRRYPDVGHGFGPGVGTSAEGWLDEAVRFWARFIRTESSALQPSILSLSQGRPESTPRRRNQ